MNENEDYVFAVDKWEGLDGLHHVTVKINGELITVKFEEWNKAEEWANYTARVMGLKKYQIDTPDRPHTWVSVRAREACRNCGLGLTEKEMMDEIVKTQKGEPAMKTKKGYTNFDGLCALLVALSLMAFVTIGIFEMRIDYGSLMAIIFGVLMPKVVKRWFLK